MERSWIAVTSPPDEDMAWGVGLTDEVQPSDPLAEKAYVGNVTLFRSMAALLKVYDLEYISRTSTTSSTFLGRRPSRMNSTTTACSNSMTRRVLSSE